MNILMITDNDPAGMGIAFTNAINRYTEHRCRLITTAEKYGFGYEKDIHLPDIEDDDFGEVEQLLKNADIIHFHVLRDENSKLGPLTIRDHIKGKWILHHHHGHPHFRTNPEYYHHKYQTLDRKALVSTPDLLKVLPAASWLPNLVPIDNPLLKPQPTDANGNVIIGQSPTRKELKNTKELISVVERLQKRMTDPPIELKLIERLPHKQCLIKKNTCHIVFDHMQGYYGVSSLESLSQGKPVIAGLDEWNRQHIKAFFGVSRLPWITAKTETELEAALTGLIEAQSLRDEIGNQSRDFMETYWRPEAVVEKLISVYERKQ